MVTRAVLNVIDKDGDTLVTLYTQYDGYPEGFGSDIAKYLQGAEVGNGIRSGATPSFFNGAGDLALRLVTALKENPNEIGGLYLIPKDEDWGQEFTYTVRAVEGEPVKMKVEGWSGQLFKGTIDDFLVWVDKRAGEDEEEW